MNNALRNMPTERNTSHANRPSHTTPLVGRNLADRRRRQKKRRAYFFATAGVLAIYFIALGIFWLIVRSPAFRVENITVEGLSGDNIITSSTILNLVEGSIIRKGDALSAPNNGWKAMLGSRNLLIWPRALPSSTVAAIPQLAGVTIEKNYIFHTVTITATERQPFAVWCVDAAAAANDGQCYWFDNLGTAFEQTPDTEGGDIVVIHDNDASDTVTINRPVLPDEFMPNLASIVSVLKASGIAVANISIGDLSLEQVDVAVATPSGAPGPTIYFSLRFPADNDLPVLASLMNKAGFYKLQYVDFTVQNRAYYK